MGESNTNCISNALVEVDLSHRIHSAGYFNASLPHGPAKQPVQDFPVTVGV